MSHTKYDADAESENEEDLSSELEDYAQELKLIRIDHEVEGDEESHDASSSRWTRRPERSRVGRSGNNGDWVNEAFAAFAKR